MPHLFDNVLRKTKHELFRIVACGSGDIRVIYGLFQSGTYHVALETNDLLSFLWSVFCK